MAHAFIDQDAYVTSTRRAIFAEPKSISFALEDLKREGFAALDSIATEYGINADMLINRFARVHS